MPPRLVAMPSHRQLAARRSTHWSPAWPPASAGPSPGRRARLGQGLTGGLKTGRQAAGEALLKGRELLRGRLEALLPGAGIDG